MIFLNNLKRLWRRWRRVPDVPESLLQLSAEDRRYLTSFYDDSVPLPAGAEQDLDWDHPALQALRERYAALGWPVCSHVQWGQKAKGWIRKTYRYFRGETPYVWQYRELPRVDHLKFFIFTRYAQSVDRAGLLQILEEDGAFGCWRYEYADTPPVSRDLLDSVLELSYLDRQLALFEKNDFRVLDIGAGYGRLAHRMLAAHDGVADYCCVDAIAESTWLCEYYLRYRGVAERARAVPLDRLPEELQEDYFDLAINVHSFSECTYAAVQWWLELVQRLRIPYLFIIPNDPDQFLTNEGEAVKRDFAPLIYEAGYELINREPVFNDPTVRELMGIEDHFYLFRRRA